mgnify:FL=1
MGIKKKRAVQSTMETIKQKVKELNSIIEKVNDGEKEFIKIWYKDPKEVQEVFLNALYKNYEDIIKKNKEEKEKKKEYNKKAEKEWNDFNKEVMEKYMEEETWFADICENGEEVVETLVDEGEADGTNAIAAIYMYYKNEFKKKFLKEQEKKNKPKSTKRKNSGGRSRKNMDGTEEVYINNESSKKQLIEDYELVKQGKKVGYFMPEDDGRVYLKYVKRLYSKNEKQEKARKKGDKTEEEIEKIQADINPFTNEDITDYDNVVVKKWINLIRNISFGRPVEEEKDRCEGAIKWADGVGNGDETGSKYCYDNDIYTMPRVLCSKKKVGGTIYCKSCPNSKAFANYYTGKYSGKAGEGDKDDDFDDYFDEYIGCNKIGNVVGLDNLDKESSDEEIIEEEEDKK